MDTGPFLQMAVFCERVLEEKDGVLSAIRIIDRVTYRAVVPRPSEEMPPFPLNVVALISLKGGRALGRHTLTLRATAPYGTAGRQLPDFSVPVLFEGGEDRGVNVILNVAMQVTHEGVYWFDVKLDDALLTRMPLRVVYEWMTLGTSSTP